MSVNSIDGDKRCRLKRHLNALLNLKAMVAEEEYATDFFAELYSATAKLGVLQGAFSTVKIL